MSIRCSSLVAAGLMLTAASALAQTQTGPDASLLYLEGKEWLKQSAAQRIALAADFMRIFCTDQTMAPASLADCLDRDETNGPLFERAIACVASSGR